MPTLGSRPSPRVALGEPINAREGSGGRTRAFISYSRRDVYFAEYITAKLKLAGIDPWLDFHRLIPGTDWSAEIAQSIEASDVFILVASPHALQSGYVESEWRAAIRAGKGIFIASVGDVALPVALQRCPVVDLRSHLGARTGLLAEYVENVVHDSANTPVPARMTGDHPAFTAVVAIALIYSVGVCALDVAMDFGLPLRPQSVSDSGYGAVFDRVNGTSLVDHANGVLAWFMVLTTLASVLIAHSVWSHSFHSSYRVLLAMSALIGSVQWLGLRLNTMLVPSRGLKTVCIVASALTSVHVLMILLLLRHIRYSSALLVRSEAGYCIPKARARLLHEAGVEVVPEGEGLFLSDFQKYSVGQAVGEDLRPGTAHDLREWRLRYRLDCELADSRLAQSIRTIFSALGLREDLEHPCWRFVVITNFSNYGRLEASFNQQDQHAIILLCTSIAKPPDWVLLRTQQWIDFRDANPESLLRFIRTLVDGKTDDSAVVPRSPETFLAPPSIQGLYAVASNTVIAVAALSGRLVWRHDLSPISVVRAIIAFITIVLLIRITRLVAGRRRPAARLRSMATIGVSSTILCGILRLVDHAVSGISLSTKTYGALSREAQFLSPFFTIADSLLTVVLVGAALLLAVTFHLAARWLPDEVATSPSVIYPSWRKDLLVWVSGAGLCSAFFAQYPMIS